MLTVRSLVTEHDLTLVAGEEAADNPIRWVHLSELPDPTPWLQGGELLLTTGIGLDGTERAFVERLAGRGLAGLGYGTGFGHDAVPDALVAAAVEAGFPVFEVPYEIPFIAITESAFSQLVNEQYGALERALQVHRRLERIVLEGGGLDELARTIATSLGGAVTVMTSAGERLAHRDFRSPLGEDAASAIAAEVVSRVRERRQAPFVPEDGTLAGKSLVVPAPSPGDEHPNAWLAFVADQKGLGDLERLVLQQAVTAIALELMRERIVNETERRLAGDVLTEAIAGQTGEAELRSRLSPFGIADRAAVIAFEVPEPAVAVAPVERGLAAAGAPGALVAVHDDLVCCVVAESEGDPIALAERALDSLGGIDARAAAGGTVGIGDLRRSFHEARCALLATRMRNGDAPRVASAGDLGAFTLLLSFQDDDALRIFSDRVLEPIERSDGRFGGELVRSLETFIEENGQWERAARRLYCHRHTLRYRIRRIEEMTGRDLSSAQDRVELWLALRARELVG